MHFTAFPHSAANGGQPKRGSDTDATVIRPSIRTLTGWLRIASAADLGHRSHTGNSPACIAQALPAQPGVAVVTCLRKDSRPFASYPPGNTAPVGRVFPLFLEITLMSHRHAPACPLCSGEGSLLGTLGLRTWFRCRQCGMDFSRTRRPRRPAPVAVTTSLERPA